MRASRVLTYDPQIGSLLDTPEVPRCASPVPSARELTA
jgi:hypothetical protein